MTTHATAPLQKSVAIEHRMDGAFGGDGNSPQQVEFKNLIFPTEIAEQSLRTRVLPIMISTPRK
jgi:hypothetical protein